jgi:CheY-like chemotaxis protein
MAAPYRVALLGFSAFERSTIASYFRLAARRVPGYALVPSIDEADLVLADADHPPSVQLVEVTERMADTVFVGAAEPPGARAWTARPVDPLHVVREFDALVQRGPPSPAPAPPRAAAPPPPPPPLRALIVDDSEVAREYLRSRLARWGVQSATVEGSAQALQQLAQRSFELVFIDIELGDDSPLDGLSLCQHLKRQRPAGHAGPTLVLISAHQGDIDRVRGTLAGAEAFLGKPLDEAQLAQLLRRAGLQPPTTV